MKTGTDAVGPDHNVIIEDMSATVDMTPMEAIPGHTIGTTDDITGVIQKAQTQDLIHIILTMTLHIKGHLTQELIAYSRDCSRSCSQSAYKPTKKTLHKSS